MAVTPTVISDIAGDGSVAQVTWPLLTATPDGVPFSWVTYSDQTFVITASNWGGATCAIEGSADGVTWVLLSDAAGGGNATATTNTAMTVVELPRYVRPNLSTVGTAAVVTVTLTARRATPLRT